MTNEVSVNRFLEITAKTGSSTQNNGRAMTRLTIELPDELIAALTAKAQTKGFSAEAYARQILEHDLVPEWLRKSWESSKAAGLDQLSRKDLLAQQHNSRMLVVNGADDYFVPQSDTLVFQGRPNTEVHLIEGTGHCAMSKAPEVVPKLIAWLPTQFTKD